MAEELQSESTEPTQTESTQTESLLGSEDNTTTEAPVDNGGSPTNQINEQMKVMWGDLADKIEWPEGMDDDLKLNQSLKPFVDKEGKIRYNDLAKSYIHTKKKMGERGVHVPDENAPQSEWDEYFKQVGWVPELEGYDLKAPEDTDMTEEGIESVKKLLHENRVPKRQAQAILDKLGESAKTTVDQQTAQLKEEIEQGVEGLKKEWGEAFNDRVGMAKKVVKEFGNEDLNTLLKEDPFLGSNPALLKFLHGIGDKMFGEDTMPGRGMRDMAKTPQEASEEINRIYGDPNDPYNKPNHPSHKDRVAYMQQLFQYKNSK